MFKPVITNENCPIILQAVHDYNSLIGKKKEYMQREISLLERIQAGRQWQKDCNEALTKVRTLVGLES